MREQNQTKTRVWEYLSLCPETSLKLPFKNSISGLDCMGCLETFYRRSCKGGTLTTKAAHKCSATTCRQTLNNWLRVFIHLGTLQGCPLMKTGAVAIIISLTPGREASTEYEPCWPAGVSPHRTGLYTFSLLLSVPKKHRWCEVINVRTVLYSRPPSFVAFFTLPLS